MAAVLDTLIQRGFFKQCTDVEALRGLLDKGSIPFYLGVDPTYRSLHAGHMVPLFAMRHLQLSGHLPILVVGGGTAMVGDPSGRTTMRQMLSREEIAHNASCIQRQISRIVEFAGEDSLPGGSSPGGGAVMVNNLDWLDSLNYLEFLREIGRHFSVNRMLGFETYRARLESGLSFIEFNYQLLQSYDFLTLFRSHGCLLQLGGDDQWGNIVAGVDLIRRMESREVFGLTAPLVTRSDGKKMGKTEEGAVFLDPELFSPYNFFQYWRNVTDEDVGKFLRLFTFLPIEEIEELEALEGRERNKAKERLAFEYTRLVHGDEEASAAMEASRGAFSQGAGGARGMDAVASLTLSREELGGGIGILELFVRSGLCNSQGEARRLVAQGGAKVWERRISDIAEQIGSSEEREGEIVIKAGKKRHFRFILE